MWEQQQSVASSAATAASPSSSTSRSPSARPSPSNTPLPPQHPGPSSSSLRKRRSRVLSSSSEDEDDDQLLMKQTAAAASPLPPLPPSPAAVRPVAPPAQLLLLGAWRSSLPPEQQDWVSKALFVQDQTGRPVLSEELQLWYHPPGPRLVYSQRPSSPDAFFQRPFFFWAPYRMWLYRLKCPDCEHKLTACGIYKTIRKVLDLDGWYYMGTEYLECRSCEKKVAGWSDCVTKQLDLDHQQLFPAVLAYKLSCDKKVLALMKTLGVGRLRSFLVEQHKAEWMRRCSHYLHTCRRCDVPGAAPPPPPPHTLPKMEPVPSSTWLCKQLKQEKTTLCTAAPPMQAPPQAEETQPAPSTSVSQHPPPPEGEEEEEEEEEEPTAGPSWASPAPSTSAASQTPKSTVRHRQRAMEMKVGAAERGQTPNRRASSVRRCGTCGLRQIKETGHRELRKTSGEKVNYCPVAAKGQNPEEWLASLHT
ncbi:uncharacterized protein [Thunnus thynnus]|uniref:uncharacterized protein n=1 Tax=Thunnus thynnus TaxID=8237 RepID=UPI003527EEB3